MSWLHMHTFVIKIFKWFLHIFTDYLEKKRVLLSLCHLTCPHAVYCTLFKGIAFMFLLLCSHKTLLARCVQFAGRSRSGLCAGFPLVVAVHQAPGSVYKCLFFTLCGGLILALFFGIRKLFCGNVLVYIFSPQLLCANKTFCMIRETLCFFIAA